MALLLPWLNIGAVLLLLLLCVALAWDARGQRKTIAALQSQVAGLSQIGKPTPEHALARRMVLPSPPARTPRAALAVVPVAMPPELPATDERHTVEIPGTPAGAEPVLDAFMRWIAHSARAGLEATPCGGARRSGAMAPLRECPCGSCARRRTFLEQAITEVLGPEAGAELAALHVLQAGQHAALVGRVMGRYRAPQEVGGAHCGGTACLSISMGAVKERCSCPCARCLQARAG